MTEQQEYFLNINDWGFELGDLISYESYDSNKIKQGIIYDENVNYVPGNVPQVMILFSDGSIGPLSAYRLTKK